MAENNNNEETTKTDIYKQQESTILMLQDVLRKQAEQIPQQIVYAQQPEPVKKPPNYLLYAGLAIVAIILLKK